MTEVPIEGSSTVYLIYYLAMSLDGYIATPDGGIEWLRPYPVEQAGEDYGYGAFYSSIDALVLGSKTYEQCLTFDPWPYAGKSCWVCSQQRLGATPPGVTVTRLGPRELVRELQRRGHRRVWLVGGGRLAAWFRGEGLVREYIVAIIPTLLGAGIPFLASCGPKEDLTLVDSKTYPNGVVQLRYQPERVVDGATDENFGRDGE